MYRAQIFLEICVTLRLQTGILFMRTHGKAVNRMDDRQIIALYFARDPRALTETAQKYGASAMQTAQHITGSRQDAEEIVNEALLILWQTIPPKDPEYFAAYLLGIVRRLAMHRTRAARRLKRGGDLQKTEFTDENAPASAENVQETVERRALTEGIGRFLDALTENQQIMFVKRYYLAHTPHEIAAEMGLPAGTVRVTLMRLKSRLKEFLEKEGLL